MHQSFTQVLCSGLALVVAAGDIQGCPIVLNDAGMVNGNIFDALLKIRDWIMTRLHNLLNQSAGSSQGRCRIIDESGLLLPPGRSEALTIPGRKGTDGEFFQPLLAPRQFSLGPAPITPDLAQRVYILGSKT